jgi:putative ABC transport system ATP-binding protein
VQGGDVLLDGKSVKALRESERCEIRRYRIGFIFQSFHLLPILQASENVEYFLTRQGVPRQERKERVREALEATGLWEHREKKPLEMSGGQRQRVAIGRAIAKQPEVIIADEPTASLDQHTGRDIMQILKELNEKKKVTIVVSSHDPMVRSFCTHEVKLVDGRIAGGGA